MKKTTRTIVVGILLTFAVVPSVMKAQSPPCPDAVNPTTPGWTHKGWITWQVPGTSCTGQVDYCYRALIHWPNSDPNSPYYNDVTYQTVIIGIKFDPSDCPNVVDTDIFNAADDAIFFDDVAQYGPLAPCNNEGHPKYHYCRKWFSCYRKETNSSGQAVLTAPNGYCADGWPNVYCELCCDICDANPATSAYRFNCTDQQVGTPPCDDAPNNNIGSWTDGTCLSKPCSSFH